jgi:hypothetical protein
MNTRVIVIGMSALVLAGFGVGLAGCPASAGSACSYAGACTNPDAGDAQSDRMVVADGGTNDSADSSLDAKDAKVDGPSKDADTGPTCTTGAAPADNGCISNDNGVFVSSTGSDEMGMGTMKSPFATITHALTKITGTTNSIYVCEGAYSDQITVSVPVNIYGGLVCTSTPWTYSASAIPVVTGSAPNFAIEVNAVSGVVDIEDMSFSAMAGTTASPSSVAAFVISSPSVTMKRTALAADAGADGSSGTAGVTGTPTPAVLTGNGADASAPGAECSITCSTGGVSTGGSGGTVATLGDGVAGTVAQMTPTPPGANGAGGTASACSSATPTGGTSGSDAVPAVAADGMGATAGTLDSLGWHPGSGQTGTSGSPGQGGGGGGSVAGWGGGGACGGCGGSGGGFGTGGGASIGLLAFNSPVQLVSCQVTTASAGNGGAGAGGGAGQAGGTKGNGSGAGCSGGNGGTGSTGGGGGGGAGGVSIGVLYGGTGVPTADTKTSIAPGTAGMLGTGGDPGENDGSAGVSAMLDDVTAL